MNRNLEIRNKEIKNCLNKCKYFTYLIFEFYVIHKRISKHKQLLNCTFKLLFCRGNTDLLNYHFYSTPLHASAPPYLSLHYQF